MEPREEFLRGNGIFAGIESGAAQRLHADEDGRVWNENFQRVPDEVFRVVRFAAAEIPVVAVPGQRFHAVRTQILRLGGHASVQ